MALSKNLFGMSVRPSMQKAILGILGLGAGLGGLLLATPAKAATNLFPNYATLVPFPGTGGANFVPAIGFKAPPETLSDAGVFNLGYHFATDFDRELKGLGVYESGSSRDHSVGIWDFTNSTQPTLVWSSTILSSTPCNLESYYCWRGFSSPGGPVLKAGVNYVVSSAWDIADPVPARVSPGDTQLAAGFNVFDPAFYDGVLTGLTADQTLYPPTASNSDYIGYIAVNLSFDTYTPSNVPAPLPLFGAAAAFGWSRKLRRRIGSTI